MFRFKNGIFSVQLPESLRNLGRRCKTMGINYAERCNDEKKSYIVFATTSALALPFVVNHSYDKYGRPIDNTISTFLFAPTFSLVLGGVAGLTYYAMGPISIPLLYSSIPYYYYQKKQYDKHFK